MSKEQEPTGEATTVITVEAAQQEVQRLEQLQVEWEQKRVAAEKEAAQLENDAGDQVLAGVDAAQVASDLAAVRARVDVGSKTLKSLSRAILNARAGVYRAQAAEVQVQLAEKREAYRLHMRDLNKLMKEIRALEGTDYIPPFSVLDPSLVVGLPDTWGYANSGKMSREIAELEEKIRNRETSAANFERQAEKA